MTVRIALLALFAALLAAGAKAAPSASSSELAYTVTLHGSAFSAGAACTGPIGELRAARRLTVENSSWESYEVSWAPDGDRLAIAGGAFRDTAIRVAAPDGSQTHAV